MKSVGVSIATVKRVAALTAVGLFVTGCTTSTVLVRNDKTSDEVKAKGFKNYTRILLVPPDKDPREVVPRVAHELENLGFKVHVAEAGKPIEAAQGTGFLVSAEGYLLTCAHVVSEEKSATVFLGGKRLFADVVSSNKDEDLALLKLREPVPPEATPLSFRDDRPYAMGDDVYTIGYPLSRLLGSGARMSRGLLSATTGLRDDPKRMQVSAEIQPGSSGGPLLDHDGRIIGIVEQTINPWRIAQATGGALPQNVNFAIKNEPTLEFVKTANADLYRALERNRAIGLDKASSGVAKVLAGIVADDAEMGGTMLVKLSYVSVWDLWYRFRLFVLVAFDLESQESLFAVGQGRDNVASTQDLVITDTLKKFKQAIGQ